MKKTSFFFLTLALLILSGLVACKKETQKAGDAEDLLGAGRKDQVILEIQDSLYTQADFERYLLFTIGGDYKSLSSESLSRLLDSFIEDKILLKAAHEENLSLTQEEQREYLARLSTESWAREKNALKDNLETQMLFENLLVEKYMHNLVDNFEVSEEEIKQYYEDHKRDFLRPQRVKVSQILVGSEEKAVELLEKVKDLNEEEFRRIARKESVGVEASKGGEMGVFEMGQLPFEMEKVIFSLKEGELSAVVESSYGYHIFRLDTKYEPELVSLEHVSSELRMKILNQKIKDFISQHTEELKTQMDWTFYPEKLSFPYQRTENE